MISRTRLLPKELTHAWLADAERRRLDVLDALVSDRPGAKHEAHAFIQSYGGELVAAVTAALLNDQLVSHFEQAQREQEMQDFQRSVPPPSYVPVPTPYNWRWLSRVFGPLLTRRTA
jgi:hypothetical protein